MTPEQDLEMNNVGRTTTEPSDAPSRSSGERSETTSNGGTSPPRGLATRTLTMPAGHPRLAELMGRRPQMAIYRRFGYLNTQNLLYMQAELVGLEKSLKDLQKRDAGEIGEQTLPRNENDQLRARDWKELSKATIVTTEVEDKGNKRNSPIQGLSCCGHRRCEEWCCGEMEPHEHCDQWNLAMKIREKLQRYNDALIQQITLASAGSPDSYDLEWIQRFLASESFGMEGALLGEDQCLWGSHENPDEAEHEDELISLATIPKRDPFNKWIFNKLVKRILDRESWWYSVLKTRALEDEALLKWTTAATSAVTATVPIVSIVVLYFTTDTNVRLALLVAFNLLAAFILYIFTDAQPMQVFAASAAYSAVNIVFIGSNTAAST